MRNARELLKRVERRMYANKPWKTSDKGEAQALMRLLKDSDHDTRMWAAEELAKTKVLRRTTIQSIVSALRKEKGPAKIMMIDSLGELRAASAAPILMSCLNDANRFTRAHAASSLAAIRHTKAGEKIERLLEVEHASVAKAWYLYALHMMGRGDRTDEMIRLLASKSRLARTVVSYFLELAATKESRDSIIFAMRKALSREPPEMRDYLRRHLRRVKKGH